MERRQFLASGTALLSVAVAGCGRRFQVEHDVRVAASSDSDRQEGGSAREELAALHADREAESG